MQLHKRRVIVTLLHLLEQGRARGHMSDPIDEMPPPYVISAASAKVPSSEEAPKGKTLDLRQLRDPQASEGQGVDRQAPTLPCSFHPDLRVLAQHGRAVLCDITTSRLRNGVFRSVPELTAAIKEVHRRA